MIKKLAHSYRKKEKGKNRLIILFLKKKKKVYSKIITKKGKDLISSVGIFELPIIKKEKKKWKKHITEKNINESPTLLSCIKKTELGSRRKTLAF